MGWMGPVVDGQEHEGWVVPLFADGAQGAGLVGEPGPGTCVVVVEVEAQQPAGPWLLGSRHRGKQTGSSTPREQESDGGRARQG